MLRSLVVSISLAFALSACASGPNATGVGATSQIFPKSAKAKRNARKIKQRTAKTCRGLGRELRRLEGKREVGSPAYDRIINKYVAKGCEGGRV